MALKSGNTSLNELLALSKASGGAALPVDKWHPEHCGEMDMVIKSDGSWHHDGVRITRAPLVKLFASVLRKDEDGETYLVTPAEKIRITVERAPFMAIRIDAKGAGQEQRLFITTNMDEVVELGQDHYLRVATHAATAEPTPLAHVRGRLDALVIRSVFYELVNLAVEVNTDHGKQLGVYSGGLFFPLGPAGIHDV